MAFSNAGTAVWLPRRTQRSVNPAMSLSTRFNQLALLYRRVAEVEERFGTLPPLRTPLAESLGFCHDGVAQQLVHRALEGLKTAVWRRARIWAPAEVCGHKIRSNLQPG